MLAAVAPHPAASAEEPRTLRIAGILSAGKEAPWETSFVASMDRVVAARPHGLEIEVDYTENVSDNAEQVFRTYAETGEYDILFGDTAYADAVEKLKDEFPDTMFVVSGSGNRGLGGNAYWVFVHAHEPAYAAGVLAGKLTRSNVVGVVSTFPAEDTNDQINAFFAGAREANPQVRRKVTFVQSWFDPQKSNEATAAQAAVGADMIFEMSGAFEACQEKRIGCFGNYVDMAKIGTGGGGGLDDRAMGSTDRLDRRRVVEGQDRRRQVRRSRGAQVVHLERRLGRSRHQFPLVGRDPGRGQESGRGGGCRHQERQEVRSPRPVRAGLRLTGSAPRRPCRPPHRGSSSRA